MTSGSRDAIRSQSCAIRAASSSSRTSSSSCPCEVLSATTMTCVDGIAGIEPGCLDIELETAQVLVDHVFEEGPAGGDQVLLDRRTHLEDPLAGVAGGPHRIAIRGCQVGNRDSEAERVIAFQFHNLGLAAQGCPGLQIALPTARAETSPRSRRHYRPRRGDRPGRGRTRRARRRRCVASDRCRRAARWLLGSFETLRPPCWKGTRRRETCRPWLVVNADRGMTSGRDASGNTYRNRRTNG